MKLWLRLVTCAFISTLTTSELTIDVQPDVISPELTSHLLVNCSVSDNHLPGFHAINSLSLSIYNETNKKFDILLLLDTHILSLKQLFQLKHAQISFGNMYLALLLYNPSESDARVYRCNVEGVTSSGKNSTIAAKKTVEFSGNVSALIEEIRRLKTNYENDLCSLKRDSKDLCSLKRDELNGKNYQRSKLNFVSNSEVIKELIEPLTLTCSLQILDDISYEKATILSMHIFHESNGVNVMISRDQPIVRTDSDTNSPSIKGELYYNAAKDSYLQVTWQNPTSFESGKYFCGALIKISEKRSERFSRMLTVVVARPTIDDLFKSIIELKKQTDKQEKSLNANDRKLKSIEEDFKEQADKQNQILNANDRKLKSIEEDFKEQADKQNQSLNAIDRKLKSIEEDFKEQADKQEKSLKDNEQKFNRVEKVLISNRQNISNFKDEIKKNVAAISDSQTEWKSRIDTDRLILSLNNQDLKTSNSIAILWKTLQEQEAKMSELQMVDKEYKHGNMSTLTNPIFLATTRFNGTLYLLSKEGLLDNIVSAQAICKLLGGYLVEVNTESEFHFLRNFIWAIKSQLHSIYTGGTDESHEGVWINRYSRTSMKTFWSPNQPDNQGGRQHCQTFWKTFDWYMDDTVCLNHSKSELGFLCEIPE